ncbi:Hypothetical protein A7982_05751 [Minicystis rosea]|nr:Hypothetical protein A7982_05751 [Minicystis rosea]
MFRSFFLGAGEARIIRVDDDALYVSCAQSTAEEQARFRFIYGGGDRNHFPVTGVSVRRLAHDGTELERFANLIAHHVVSTPRARVAVFWHGPARAGVHWSPSGAYGWELASGRQIWHFREGVVAMLPGHVLGLRDNAYELVEIDTGNVVARPTCDGQVVASALDDAHLYVAVKGSGVRAYVRATGNLVWSSKLATSLVGFGLALAKGELFMIGDADGDHSTLVALDAATGKPTAEHELDDYATELTANGWLVREGGVDRIVPGAPPRNIVKMRLQSPRLRSNAHAAMLSDASRAKSVLLVTAGGADLWKSTNEITQLTLGPSHLAFCAGYGAYVASYEALQDPKAKSLAEGGSAVLARAKVPALKPHARARALAQLLEDEALAPPLSAAARDRLLLEIFGTDAPTGDDALAVWLGAVSARAARQPAFITHDWRYGQETDDVIAELDAPLEGEPVRFRQVSSDKAGVTMSVVRDDATSSVRFEGDDASLDQIAARVDQELHRAGAARRIYRLDFDGEQLSYLIVTPDVVARLRKAKVKGICDV